MTEAESQPLRTSTDATEDPAVAPEGPPADEAVATEAPPAGEAVAPEAPPAADAVPPEAPPAGEGVATEAPPAAEALAPEAPPAEAVPLEAPPAAEAVEVSAPAEPGGEPAGVSADLEDTTADDLAGTTVDVLGRPPTRLISPRIHGMLDYLTGSLLVAAPAVLGLRYGSAAGRALWMAGAGHAAYSLFTDYELGAVKAIPMRVHLALDTAGAVALATSPWALVKRRRDWRHWAPHAFLGAYELAAVAMSDPGE